MIKGISKLYSDLNMQHKIFISFLFLISVSFLIFIALNTYVSSKDLKAQAMYSSRQVFEQSRLSIEHRIDLVKRYMIVASTNTEIQRMVKIDSSKYTADYGLYNINMTEIRKQLFNACPSTDIAQTRLYLNGSIVSAGESEDILEIAKIKYTDWYRSIASSNNAYEWFYTEEVPVLSADGQAVQYISGVRKMPDNDNLNRMLGVLRVDIPVSVFVTLLDHVGFYKTSSVYLVNSSNEILCTCSTAKEIDTSFFSNLVRNYSKDSLKSGVWNNVKSGNQDYLVGIQNIRGTNWNMIITVPYEEILSSLSKNLQQMLFIMLLIAPVMFILAFFIAASGTKRIRKLISNMKVVQKGDFNVSILQGSRDEIGLLTNNFNTMVTKIAILMDEKYKLGQDIKSSELKALQAQINPHFLYNTLDLICWKAMKANENSIYDLVQALSTFYKLSLSKGSDVVTLKNEIDHVLAYVEVQNARFKNCITLEIDIPEQLYHYKVPKITLQPIIENSIIHGILETKDGRGTIKITGYAESSIIILEVTDDGVGIPKEKMNTIFNENNSTNSLHGYGINNINKRIKLLYGEEFGLAFTSRQGVGTTVRITLPHLLSVLEGSEGIGNDLADGL